MKVVSRKTLNQLNKSNDHNRANYLLKDRSQLTLILNNYKTAKQYGQRTIKLDPATARVVNKWLKNSPNSDYLFLDNRNQPLTANGITRKFNSIFKPYGKRISSTMLRHISLTHKYADQVAERKRLAETMMHSPEMQQQYIKTDQQ